MIKIRKETETEIRRWATKKGVTPPEAVTKIVKGYFARLGALARYAQKQKAPKAKKGAKKAVKKSGKKGNGQLRKAA